MYPIDKRTDLTIAEISRHWSRDSARAGDLSGLMISDWWRGRLYGPLMPDRFDVLKRLFKKGTDSRCLFLVEGEAVPPIEVEQDDGSVLIDLRHRIIVPNGDPETWTEHGCEPAFEALADRWSTIDPFDLLAPGFLGMKVRREDFGYWTLDRGYPWPKFWAGPAPRRKNPGKLSIRKLRDEYVAAGANPEPLSQDGFVKFVKALLPDAKREVVRQVWNETHQSGRGRKKISHAEK